MLIVGERLNTSRHPVNEAVERRDARYVEMEAKAQIEAGADLVDVNAGSRRDSEIEDLSWLIQTVQQAMPRVRLCLDSPRPATLQAVLDQIESPPMLNSVTGERARFEAMAPMLGLGECDILAMAIDERGIPKSAEQTLETALRLVGDLEGLGVRRERIYVDPVIQTVSANTSAALVVLESIGRIRRELPGVNLICGLSNISFGLPRRPLVNRTFLALAMRAGLTAAILDPLDGRLMGTLRATEVLLGHDPWCQAYTRAFREGRLQG